MLAFIQAQPSIVERLLQHIEVSSFVDLLVRIIQLDETPAGSGVVEVCVLLYTPLELGDNCYAVVFFRKFDGQIDRSTVARPFYRYPHNRRRLDKRNHFDGYPVPRCRAH